MWSWVPLIPLSENWVTFFPEGFPNPQILGGFFCLNLFGATPLEQVFGIKLVGGHSQQRRQHHQFLVRHIPQPGFNLPHRGTADVQSGQLAMCGQFLLGQFQSPPHFAYLGADHVCWILLSRHAEIELDPIGNARFICYASVTRRNRLGSLRRDFCR